MTRLVIQIVKIVTGLVGDGPLEMSGGFVEDAAQAHQLGHHVVLPSHQLVELVLGHATALVDLGHGLPVHPLGVGHHPLGVGLAPLAAHLALTLGF